MDLDIDLLRGYHIVDPAAGCNSTASSSPTANTEMNEPNDGLLLDFIELPDSRSESSALSPPEQIMADPGCSAEDYAFTEQAIQTAVPIPQDGLGEDSDGLFDEIHHFIAANLPAVQGGTCGPIWLRDLQIPVVSGKESARFSKSAESSPPGTFCIVSESLHNNRDFGNAQHRRDGTPNPLKWIKKGDRWERTVSWKRRKGAEDDLVYAPPPACVHLRLCAGPASLACAGG
jgi:hypothetical protein